MWVTAVAGFLLNLGIRSFFCQISMNLFSYIDEFDRSGKPDVHKHGHFYSLCQVSVILRNSPAVMTKEWF